MAALTEGGGGGVAAGRELATFAEAIVGAEGASLADAIPALRQAVGDDGWVDAAGVAATFNAIDRLADATGIPLEEKKAEISSDFREKLGLDAFRAARG